tara:strand:- start:558 stop:899 length:342 start_codon:yes stop_codon:yes gene_type:complete
MIWGAIVVLMLYILSGCKTITSTTVKRLSPVDTNVTRSTEYQQEIDDLLAADAENKRWEKIYLKEIKAAQENQDHDAYLFFIKEYISIPRLPIPEWMQQLPGYVPRIKPENLD